MSKVLINNLINEINTLLRRPVGSVSRHVSPDTVHQREQLKQLRSQLETLTDDAYVGSLDQQYQALVQRLQVQIYANAQPSSTELSTDIFKADKLEMSPPPLVAPLISNLFDAESNLTKETSTMTNGISEPDSTLVNDRMIASLQQAIQQTLQQVVKESVQQSIQQVVSQTLAVERALMVGEISANLNKFIESQQRSQINQELINLNDKKQKLSDEISQLELDRANWMQQFKEFQSTQQESLNRSLQSVDSLQETMALRVTDSVNQTVAKTLQDNLAQLSTANSSVTNPSISEVNPPSAEFVSKVQEQTDRFLLQLDQMFNSTFRSLEQEIQGYQSSITAKIGHMETLEQKGEELINTLVARISQHEQQLELQSPSIPLSDQLPELPDEIPIQYLETFTEPADENLINALLAGDQFGESIVEEQEVVDEPIETNDALDKSSDKSGNEHSAPVMEKPRDGLDIVETVTIESHPEPDDSITDSADEYLTPQTDVLGIQSHQLGGFADLLVDADKAATESIPDYQSAISAHEMNPDFDLEAATQIVEKFEELSSLAKDPNDIDLLAVNFPAEELSTNTEEINDPQLLQWLEANSNQTTDSVNIAEVSADEDLLLWLGNQSVDISKISTPEETTPIKLSELTTDLEETITEPTRDDDESLILLASQDNENVELSTWEDSLVNELSSDLQRLDAGMIADPIITDNLDQFIRNTPYALTDWGNAEPKAFSPIIEVAAQQTNGHTTASETITDDVSSPSVVEDNLSIDSFADSSLDKSGAKSEIVVNIEDLQLSPFKSQIEEIPIVFDSSTSSNLSDVQELETVNEPDISEGLPEISLEETSVVSEAKDDDMDAIFAEVIAENAAKYSPSVPFEVNDELDSLFLQSLQDESQAAADLDTERASNLSSSGDNEIDTLLMEFDTHNSLDNFNYLGEADTSMQQMSGDEDTDLDTSADTITTPLSFAEPVTEISEDLEELDTILQGFNQPSTTNHVVEISTSQPTSSGDGRRKQDKSATDLSAEEFFASLEEEKLNNFANVTDSGDSKSSELLLDAIADLINFVPTDKPEEEEEDSILNEFADAHGDNQTETIDSDWDKLLKDLSTFSFNEPLLDDQREQLGLSSVAPISDTSENVLDIDSLVLESESVALIPAPPENEVYSLDDNWILGIDIGSSAIRASLLNADTGRVYSLYLDDSDEILCKVVWNEEHSLDDPITKDVRVLPKRSQNPDLDHGEIVLSHFKQLLKLGLPYRGVSVWQPIIQWSNSYQISMRWLLTALKSLLEQIQTRANHPKLPDLGLILLKLSGVVFNYPSNWSDTYILNVREAILHAGLVSHAEQILAVEQAIAPALSLLHNRKIAKEITLFIDAGAVTTSICLSRGLDNGRDSSKLHVRSLDYAGISLSQDIVTQLFYPHWQLITNPNRHLCNFDQLSLPEVGTSAPQQRILLQQYLLSSTIGQQMLELADRVKVAFGRDVGVDSWNEDLMGQPIVVLRREVENLILQPFMQRINRELNSILSNAGILGEDVQQVLLLGSTMQIPLLSRWLAQKLPNAKIDPLATSAVANGLAVAPLYPQLQDVARQQYSDYFLLQEICRLNLNQAINPNQLLQQLQMRGVNIKTCRDRILSILQGDLPEGLFPWQEPESSVILEDPTLGNELFTGRLFDLETDGTYQPNMVKFQQLRVYLQAIIGNMHQTLTEPLVFPEIKTIALAK
ncbi:hypothetical protein [Pseudanabaena mucicola]|uniref:Uncharacterized protein n=1 Tax=Pseudanabaena mucicola FACHB-723 TaxID=2692860 RepID=A0ABR7ZWW6_9CYAN|nr:hypothetical protein [Pseudanabaena mucicola]MBD2188249.1 hypothetical protein [Pseudanabaena mucicola FACHB-723]